MLLESLLLYSYMKTWKFYFSIIGWFLSEITLIPFRLLTQYINALAQKLLFKISKHFFANLKKKIGDHNMVGNHD